MGTARIALSLLAGIAAGASRAVIAANSCGSAPLPTTPSGPTTTTTWDDGSNGAATVTSWRIPCSATDSMVVLTLTPATGSGAFICPPDMTLLQSGGLQTSSFYFRPDPPTSGSFCNYVIAPVSVALFPNSSTPAAFDFDQGFSIDYNGSTHQALPISAFDPAAYSLTPPPGPDSVNLFVQGANVQYQNCTVSSSVVGGGKQYTASCALEAPIKAAEFDKYDY